MHLRPYAHYKYFDDDDDDDSEMIVAEQVSTTFTGILLIAVH